MRTCVANKRKAMRRSPRKVNDTIIRQVKETPAVPAVVGTGTGAGAGGCWAGGEAAADSSAAAPTGLT